MPWVGVLEDVGSVPARADVFGSGFDDDEAWVSAGADVRTVLPGPMSSVVVLESGRSVSVAGEPVAVELLPVGDGGDGARVSVEVVVGGAEQREVLGATAMVFEVRRSDGGRERVPVRVSVDYSGFAGAFGGGFSDRLLVRRYRACVLETPEVASCWDSEVVASDLDPESETISVELDAASPSEAARPDGAGEEVDVDAEGSGEGDASGFGGTDDTTTTTVAEVVEGSGSDIEEGSGGPLGAGGPGGVRDIEDQPLGGDVDSVPGDATQEVVGEGSLPVVAEDLGEEVDDGGFVYALTSGPDGHSGNFAATPLNAAMGWQAGGSSGDASYSIPIEVPVATVGPTPELSLAYSSQSSGVQARRRVMADRYGGMTSGES